MKKAAALGLAMGGIFLLVKFGLIEETPASRKEKVPPGMPPALRPSPNSEPSLGLADLRGKVPPEIWGDKDSWLNSARPLRLAELKGKVVWLEFGSFH